MAIDSNKRNELAAAAMLAILINNNCIIGHEARLAQQAYAIADAMIKQSKTKGPMV